MAYIFGAMEWITILKLVAFKRWKCEMTKTERNNKNEIHVYKNNKKNAFSLVPLLLKKPFSVEFSL